MKVLITGGGGFLGQKLAAALLADTTTERVLLVDRFAPPAFADERVSSRALDISDPNGLSPDLMSDFDVIYHLAAVVSGEAEADFDLGMRVNVDGSRFLLEACRAAGHVPRVVFTSSVAVFGPLEHGETIDDRTATEPRSSYGMEKAVAELLLRDYSRRGFVDGIVLRLPTVSVRPGQPNRAASSFASGIIREPLNGLPSTCPVRADVGLWLHSPRAAVANLHLAASMPRLVNPVVNLPGLAVTVGEMIGELRRLEGDEVARLVEWSRDPAIEAIVANWPARWDDSTARKLGFVGDESMEAVIRAYVADELGR